MEYCKQGDKPIVKYSFNGKERSYKSEVSPIEVTTKEAPIEGDDSYSNEGYQISGYSTNNRRNFTQAVRAHRMIDTGNPNFVFRYILSWIACGQTKFNDGLNVDPSTISINSNIRCPLPQKNRCSVVIKHKGSVIFQDQGDCPVEAKVQCGKCPDGYIECPKPLYPGYCCISCQGTAQKIRNLGG